MKRSWRRRAGAWQERPCRGLFAAGSPRIGAVHSVVFSGFCAEALCVRIGDCQAQAVMPAVGGHPRWESAVVDAVGTSISEADQGRYCVIKRPWPSMRHTSGGGPQRDKDTYWPRLDGKRDLVSKRARKVPDDHFWTMGRIDELVNVFGHRLGTMEIEFALVTHERVAEADVLSIPHDIKGEGVFAFTVLEGQRPKGGVDQALTRRLIPWVAKPEDIRHGDHLPTTRSAKITHWLLPNLAQRNKTRGNTSTLDHRSIVERIRGAS